MKKTGFFKNIKDTLIAKFKRVPQHAERSKAVLSLLFANAYPNMRKGKRKQAIPSLLKNILIMAVVFFVFWFLAGKIMNFLSIKVNGEFLSIALLLTSVLGLAFATTSIITKMYLSNDNNLLLSLPISFNELFIAKVVMVYISEFMFNLIYILPIFCAIGVIGGVGALYYVGVIVLLPFISVLPIALGALISIPIMFIVKFFKSRPVVTIVVSIIAIIAVFVGYMFIVRSVSGAFNIAEEQISNSLKVHYAINDIGGKLFCYTYIMRALESFFITKNIVEFMVFFGILLLYLIGSVIVLLPCLLLIKHFFQSIETMNEQTPVIKVKGDKKFKKRSQFRQLLDNEFKMILRSPNQLFKYFLITILMPLIVFTYDFILKDIVVNDTGNIVKYASHYFALFTMVCLSSLISSVAISKQGSLFYLTKTLPVDYKKQITVKAVFNCSLTIGMVLITMIVVLATGVINVWQVTVCSALSAIFICIGHVCHSIDLDLRKPTLSWYDVSDIDELSKNTATSVLIGLLISAASFLIMYLTYTLRLKEVVSVSIMEPVIVVLILSILYAIFRVYFLYLRVQDELERMEL